MPMTSPSEVTIILCAGRINPRDLPLPYTPSIGLVPVNGKPVIEWLLDDLIRRELTACIIVARTDDERLRELVERTHGRRMRVSVCPVAIGGTILDSLKAGIARARSDFPSAAIRVLLGDTLIVDELPSDGDYVCVKEVEDSERWCLAQFDEAGLVRGFIDKPVQPPAPPFYALAGFYRFADPAALESSLAKAQANGARELAAVLTLYLGHHPLRVRPIETWYDFGHIDRLVEARRQLLRPRFFNDLQIDPVLSTITKRSRHETKLRDECDWFREIPDDLKALTPRILSREESDTEVCIVQEYYGYPTLAELFVFGDLHRERWESILRHLFRVHARFRAHRGRLAPSELREIYSVKTWRRVAELAGQGSFWQKLLETESIELNGRPLRGLSRLREALTAAIEHLVETADVTVVHGDFCFSNILFDLFSQVTRLIDPRGNFGRKGIYGDARYDLAKLRHSACGLYDFIIADMFEVRETPGGWEFEIFAPGSVRDLPPVFDAMVMEGGGNPRDIRIIEGLLFLSMPPLHQDHPQRQLAMLLQALRIFNEILP